MDVLSLILYNAGCQQLGEGRVDVAERLFQLCLEHDPANSKARANLTFCLSHKGSPYRDLAKKAVQTLREEDPLLANYRGFNSFEGLPDSNNSAIDQLEASVQTKLWAKGTCTGLSEHVLREFLAAELDESETLIHMHKGWFAKAIPTLASDQRFAIVHVDCDLYSSTCDLLDGLLSRGMVLEGALDDWWCNRGARDLGEQRAWSEAVTRYDISFSDRGDYGPMSRIFVVHSYRNMPVAHP